MRLYSIVLPYLLLVSFYTPTINNFGLDKIKAINESPYYGVAVPLIDAYDANKYTDKDFESAVKLIKENSKKDIWPWIFFNRFVGYEKKENAHRSTANREIPKYFRDIKGMDIFNESGAFEDFCDIWRISLRIAKQLSVPGIVVDPETYNDYKNDNVSYLSKELGKSEDEINKSLIGIGKKLVDIAEKEYPVATLWFLYTGLGNTTKSFEPLDRKDYRTASYIILGMLEYIKEKQSKIKITSGGEVSLGYCNESLEDLQERIKKREIAFETVLGSYPYLFLGGTIAPWNSPELKTDWMLKGKCGNSKLKNINDFKPLIKLLFSPTFAIRG